MARAAVYLHIFVPVTMPQCASIMRGLEKPLNVFCWSIVALTQQLL